jgi:hypothetical protein
MLVLLIVQSMWFSAHVCGACSCAALSFCCARAAFAGAAVVATAYLEGMYLVCACLLSCFASAWQHMQADEACELKLLAVLVSV